jgi:hypothetical protein
MAVAFGHSSTGSAASATSLSFSHTATGDSYLVAIISARLTTGGCSTSDITNLAITYAGVSLSFNKGSVSGGVNPSTGACVFGYVMSLANPTTGANTLSATWTGTASVTISVMSFSGAGSIGTIVEHLTASGTTFTAAQTITANDMMMGGLAIADATTSYALVGSNQIEVSESNNTGSGAVTNTGSGSVTVNGTCTASQAKAFWGIPLLASGSSSAIKTFDGLATASVKTVNGLAIASVKNANGLA